MLGIGRTELVASDDVKDTSIEQVQYSIVKLFVLHWVIFVVVTTHRKLKALLNERQAIEGGPIR